jgi:hypothetical protein
VNFLEELVAEWYEYLGYFVRRNIRVGPLPNGGFEGELDVVAFNPINRHLIHIETSSDSDSWIGRKERFTHKFSVGRRHIPTLFNGLPLPQEIEQVALFVYGSSRQYAEVGGGKVLSIKLFISSILDELATKPVASKAVPEQYPLLRALQFAANFWHREHPIPKRNISTSDSAVQSDVIGAATDRDSFFAGILAEG